MTVRVGCLKLARVNGPKILSLLESHIRLYSSASHFLYVPTTHAYTGKMYFCWSPGRAYNPCHSDLRQRHWNAAAFYSSLCVPFPLCSVLWDGLFSSLPVLQIAFLLLCADADRPLLFGPVRTQAWSLILPVLPDVNLISNIISTIIPLIPYCSDGAAHMSLHYLWNSLKLLKNVINIKSLSMTFFINIMTRRNVN